MLIRLLAVLEIVLIALGLALTGSGYWRQVYWLASAGILALGAGTAIGGLETNAHPPHRPLQSVRNATGLLWALQWLAMKQVCSPPGAATGE
jgi:hypothetical protein